MTILEGDNLFHMKDRLRVHGGPFATLVYMDPPYLTQRDHKDRDGEFAFTDRWLNRTCYMNALMERVRLARELLLPHGSLVIHVDPKTSHYIKVACDETFGEDHFASEIIWRYRRWPTKTPNFQRVHDVLLRYRKDVSTEPRWNQLYEDLAPSTKKTWGTKKQKAVTGDDGQRVRSSTTEEESKGVPMGDVWDISIIAPVAKERTGWPTQKPEKLLERLVLSLTDSGETVVDPYMGSGTSCVVAKRHGRHYLGIDASPKAIETAKIRMLKEFAA